MMLTLQEIVQLNPPVMQMVQILFLRYPQRIECIFSKHLIYELYVAFSGKILSYCASKTFSGNRPFKYCENFMKHLWSLSALTLLIGGCAPITPLQSPRIDQGVTFHTHNSLIFMKNTEKYNPVRALTFEYDSNSVPVDTIDTVDIPAKSNSSIILEVPGAWYMSIGIRERVELSFGNLYVLNGECLLKVNLFDISDKTMWENQALALFGGFAIDLMPRYYVMTPGYVMRTYAGFSWGVISPVYDNNTQVEFIVSPSLSREEYYYSEHSSATTELIYLNIPVGAKFRFGYRQQAWLNASLTFRPELHSVEGECDDDEYGGEYPADWYQDNVIFKWDLEHFPVVLSAGFGINIGRKRTRKAGRERYEQRSK